MCDTATYRKPFTAIVFAFYVNQFAAIKVYRIEGDNANRLLSFWYRHLKPNEPIINKYRAVNCYGQGPKKAPDSRVEVLKAVIW